MKRDDELRVRLGRIRDRRGGRHARGFVGRVLAAAEKSGYGLGRSGRRAAARRAFGRGQAATIQAERLLSDRARRVVVKARMVRHRQKAVPLRAHLTYLKRDGVARDGERARMFDARGDDADERAFARRCEGDRHHFRFTVSPEDTADMTDLKAFTRDLMADMERDLGTRLDWMAVDHWNTDNPHVHVVLRGKSEHGDDLVISREYISRGMRARAAELVTLELGPRSEMEIQRKLAGEVTAERWTRLDQLLQRLQAASSEGVIDLRSDAGERSDSKLRPLMIGRLQYLERTGLARPVGLAQWMLAGEAEPTLRDLAIRGDIVKTIHRAMTRRGHERAASDYALDEGSASITGKVVDKGIDEQSDRPYLVIDGIDGRVHYTRLAALTDLDDVPMAGVVTIQPVPAARATATSHSRATVEIEVTVHSDLPIERQVTVGGATWLDRELAGRHSIDVAEHGFGREVRDALRGRGEHLVGQGLARRQAGRIVVVQDLLATLQRREFAEAGASIARETGLEHRLVEEGERVSGGYRRRVDLASGRFAMLEDGRQFVLVPWRPIVERERGRELSAVIRGDEVSWSLGRSRGPSIG